MNVTLWHSLWTLHFPSSQKDFFSQCTLLRLFFFLLWQNIHDINFTILTVFKCRVSDIKYIYTVATITAIHLQNFLSPQTETIYPFNTISSLVPSPTPLITSIRPDNQYSTFCLYEFDFLSTSYKQSHTICSSNCQCCLQTVILLPLILGISSPSKHPKGWDISNRTLTVHFKYSVVK